MWIIIVNWTFGKKVPWKFNKIRQSLLRQLIWIHRLQNGAILSPPQCLELWIDNEYWSVRSFIVYLNVSCCTLNGIWFYRPNDSLGFWHRRQSTYHRLWYMGFQYQYQYAIFHIREKEIMRSHFSDHKKDQIKFSILRPKYNGRYFADEILNWWFYGEIYCILIQISPNIVLSVLIGNTSHVANGSWAHTPDVFKIICCL